MTKKKFYAACQNIVGEFFFLSFENQKKSPL
jgi:hypothetical protein